MDLCVQELYWGNDGAAYYVRGHVPLDEFLEAVRKQWGDVGNPEKARHCWARLIPRTGRDYDQEFLTQDKPAPGAFACTFWAEEE